MGQNLPQRHQMESTLATPKFELLVSRTVKDSCCTILHTLQVHNTVIHNF